MAEFYSEANRREHFSAPQLTRVRHRYRGPRESEKINLEINQLAFSIRRLYEMYKAISDEFANDVQLLTEGGVITVEEEDGATPTPVYVDGLDELAAKLESLMKRVESLEENNA